MAPATCPVRPQLPLLLTLVLLSALVSSIVGQPTSTAIYSSGTLNYNGIVYNPIDGYLYVVDTRSLLLQLSTAGTLVSSISISSFVPFPSNTRGLAVDSQGRLYLVDSSSNSRVTRFSVTGTPP